MNPGDRHALTLVGPAALLFLGVVATPLAMTLLLSVNDWNSSQGIVSVITSKNYVEILSDSYFAEIFLRTLRISLWVTVICVLIGAINLVPLFR